MDHRCQTDIENIRGAGLMEMDSKRDRGRSLSAVEFIPRPELVGIEMANVHARAL